LQAPEDLYEVFDSVQQDEAKHFVQIEVLTGVRKIRVIFAGVQINATAVGVFPSMRAANSGFVP
jgi:hypothetical protein